ncbi:MAG: hypothetical protein E7172_04675 [Firmicutes bacterium]|nr:hypothetical protein [Bacillota bacterium]
MYNIIERYMNKLTKEDISNFASSKNCELSDEELDFTFKFIKKNWAEILKNPNIFDINRYKNYYSEDNFLKIKKVYREYSQRFSAFL